MREEVIRGTPSWYGGAERRNTVLIQNGDDDEPMGGLVVARVHAFLGFRVDEQRYTPALVTYSRRTNDLPDPLTGMWTLMPEVVEGGAPGERKLDFDSYRLYHS